MLLAAQSMAVGTVMVHWVCQYSDPIMATGWVLLCSSFNIFLLACSKPSMAYLCEMNLFYLRSLLQMLQYSQRSPIKKFLVYKDCLNCFPSLIVCSHETGDGSTWFLEVYHYLHCQYGSKTLLLVGTYKTSTLMTGEHFSIPHCLAVPSAMVSSFTMLPEVNIHDITLLLALFLFTLLSLNSVL